MTCEPPSSRADGLADDDSLLIALQEAHQRIENLETNLREMHHRVKNQMQMIAGLLELHAGYADNQCCSERLREAMGCLFCMSELHHLLSRDVGNGTADCREYFGAVAKALRRSNNVPGHVTLKVHAPKQDVNASLLSTAGVLATELVTNAVRHAFPDGAKGEVSLDLVSGRHTLTIIVHDNGVGLPPDMDPATGGGLGFDIVRNTARQRGGRMVVVSDHHGTTVTVSMSLN